VKRLDGWNAEIALQDLNTNTLVSHIQPDIGSAVESTVRQLGSSATIKSIEIFFHSQDHLIQTLARNIMTGPWYQSDTAILANGSSPKSQFLQTLFDLSLRGIQQLLDIFFAPIGGALTQMLGCSHPTTGSMFAYGMQVVISSQPQQIVAFPSE
jgi:hypothetical protein